VNDRAADAPYGTNLPIRPHNPSRQVEAARICQHLLHRLDDQLSIVRVYEAQIFLGARGASARLETVNPKALGRPVVESTSVECETTRATQPLCFCEIGFHASSGFLGPLALRQVEHEGNTLVLAFKARSTNQYGHAAAVLADVLPFKRLQAPGALDLCHELLTTAAERLGS